MYKCEMVKDTDKCSCAYTVRASLLVTDGEFVLGTL